jgi:hypothetical protein
LAHAVLCVPRHRNNEPYSVVRPIVDKKKPSLSEHPELVFLCMTCLMEIMKLSPQHEPSSSESVAGLLAEAPAISAKP